MSLRGRGGRSVAAGLAGAAIAVFLGWAAASADNASDRLVIVMSGDTPPYHSVDPHGNLRGFDIDLARSVGRILKKEVDLRILPQAEISKALADGSADIAVGVTVDPAEQKNFALSRPYLNQRTRLFIRENTNVINELSDLNHLRVGVRDGIDLKEALRFLPASVRVVEPGAEAGLKSLMNRATDAFIGDENECNYFIQKQQLKEIVTAGDPLLMRRRVFAVRTDRPGLADQITQAIDDLQKSYQLQEMQDQWFAVRIAWMGSTRGTLAVFLGVVALMAAVLLASVLWNQQLAEAIARTTREVESEHEHFQNIFDHASDGILVIDPETLRTVEANRTFLDIMQYTLEDLKRLKLSDLDASEDRSFGPQIRRAFTSGENVLFEVRLVNRSREPVDFFIHAKVLPYRDKNMVEAIARDITQRKKLEAMKDTILQDVAHELKTPMAKLMVSLEILENKLTDDIKARTAAQLDICRRATARLQHTVEGILHLSRLESHAAHVQMGEVTLQEVVGNVLHELADLAERKGILLEKAMPDASLKVRGDAEMIRRLFVNLVQNAIKFTDRGKVNVELAADEEFVKICVRDTGIGLDAEDMTRIFSRFFQKSAAVEGSGIGLTIAQKIVAFHNGVIWAESEGLGKGTQMFVLLPLDTGKNRFAGGM